MAVILILILASLGLAGAFLLGFLWAVRSGQFEDGRTPALRILTEDKAPPALSRQAALRDRSSHRV
jgi:cbb3-type cytochrome oxidase maturation protein